MKMIIGIKRGRLRFTKSIISSGRVSVVINISDVPPDSDALCISYKPIRARNLTIIPDVVWCHR